MRQIAVTVLSLLLLGGSPLSAQDLDPALFSAMKVRSIGPAGMSGRIAAIDGLASDPNILWVGAATGGVWKSSNGGTTWTPVFDHERVSGIGAVAIDQNSPDVVWVGTGEGNPRNSAGVGAGLYKTMDGGDTWQFLGFGESERIHRIVLHPTNSDIAWIGVMGPAWSDGEERGVYKTIDGGQSFRRVLWVDERTGVSDLVIDPSNPMKLYAGMWEFRREPWALTSGGPGSGLFVSHDGGENWSRYGVEHGMPAGDLGRIGLSVAASDPDIVFALVEAEKSALLRTSDGGRTWTTVNDEAARSTTRTFSSIRPTSCGSTTSTLGCGSLRMAGVISLRLRLTFIPISTQCGLIPTILGTCWSARTAACGSRATERRPGACSTTSRWASSTM